MTDDEADELIRRYDPFAEAQRPDWPATYRAMRAKCPVHRFTNFAYPLFTAARHADIKHILKNAPFWSSRFGQAPMYIEEKGLVADPPQHTMYRRMLNPIFSTRRIDSLRGRITEIIDRQIDGFIARGHGDLYRDLNSVFPIAAAAELLGIDPARHDDFRAWTKEYINAQLTANVAAADAARAKIAGYFAPLLDARRALLARDPGAAPDDAINVLVTAEHPDGRPFTNEEIFPPLNNLITGASDTTALLISNCVYRLLERRELWEQVCANPELCEVAIEESLRFDPPIMGVFRTNREAVTLHGEDLPANSKLQVCFASGNRDEQVWKDSETFRLDRDYEHLRQHQLGFGHGIRFCIGAHLVRLDTSIALRRLVARMPTLRLAGEPKYFQVMQMQGVIELPVAWDVAA